MSTEVTEALLAQSLLLILASAVAVGALAALRMPAVSGYLLAGVIVGPHGLHLLADADATRALSELGLVFLMFMVGLELSLPSLVAAYRDVLLAGALQVGGTLLPVAGLLRLIGMDWPGAVVIGAAVAMSSTAMATKQLSEDSELAGQHGRLAVSILLFQDLAGIPLLVLVEAWSQRTPLGPAELGRHLGFALTALLATAILARPLIRLIFAGVGRSRSNDLFLLAVLLVALGAAWFVHLAGLARPIGAFIAGMVIGESDFKHRVEDDVRPFRDVLVGLFFVTAGMTIDPLVLVHFPLTVLVWCAIFLIGKAVTCALAVLLLRYPVPTALRVGVILAHGGEFGLLLMTLALSAGLVPAAIGQPVLIALTLSMGVAPLIIQRNGRAERLLGLRRHHLAATEAALRDLSASIEQHAVLCGCGRIGRVVALALETAKLPYIAIELDLGRFREAQRQGHKVVHGDATHRRILAAAGIARVKLIVVTFDRRASVERILAYAHEQTPAPSCLVNAADDREVAALVKAGATAVFPENLAAGLGLADQSLLLCGMTQDEAAHIITRLRGELNPELRDRVGI